MRCVCFHGPQEKTQTVIAEPGSLRPWGATTVCLPVLYAIPGKLSMTDTADKSLQAFQLGWTLTEILGRVRRGARPARSQRKRPPDYAPRLSVSTGELRTSTDQFHGAVLRWEALSYALELIGDQALPDDPMRAPIERQKRALAGETDEKFGPPVLLRRELQQWSLAARAKLLAQDQRLARAMRTGASLGDTFWHLRRAPEPSSEEKETQTRAERIEARQSDKVSSEEDWRRLLSDDRLKVERVWWKGLAEALPPYIPEVLAGHLRYWQIGRELAYDGRGRLYRLPWYRRLRWPWRRPGWMGGGGPRRTSPVLLPEDENAIQRALERQVKYWQDMLFGWRRPDQYLWRRDQSLVMLLRTLGLLLAFILMGVGLAFLAYGWWRVLQLVVGPAVADVLAQGSLDDRLKLLSASAGWLTTVFMIIRTMLGWVPKVYRWLDQNLTARRVARRTLVAWDRYLPQEAA
jgi:hypothetical protein